MMTQGMTIFYADDDLEDLDFFREVALMIDDTVEVYTHNKGEMMLDALKNPPPKPHIIFLDLNMPGKNGFEILKELKSSDAHKTIPVIVFSTSSDENVIARSRSLGAHYYLPKLPSYEAFKKSIEDIFNINWATFEPDEKNFLYSA